MREANGLLVLAKQMTLASSDSPLRICHSLSSFIAPIRAVEHPGRMVFRKGETKYRDPQPSHEKGHHPIILGNNMFLDSLFEAPGPMSWIVIDVWEWLFEVSQMVRHLALPLQASPIPILKTTKGQLHQKH